ncbi:phage tail tube protein [Paenibacillus sedimenti]|uniref:Histidine kinase n=1 Tax=Paenibacillus sedimenti TaxID=2770274 RepID=A0A926KP29_9BACL|nr:phage tail tube protein [Paenibacillus sedimenti]MBD0381285.1 histidine kinase [Paenibacillus sedimenti]
MPQRSLGTKIRIGANFIAGLTDIGPPQKSAETIDATTLDSPGGYRTFVQGFKDAGEVSISGYFESGDVGQVNIDSIFESGAFETFEILYPNGSSYTFSGIVTGLNGGSATLDGLLAWEATIKISGSAPLATTASSGLTALSLTGAGGTLSPAFSAGNRSYTFGGVTASSITVTATAASHALKLYIDGVYSQDLTSGSASAAIALTLNVGKKLTIIATESGKTSVVYEIVAIKTA